MLKTLSCCAVFLLSISGAFFAFFTNRHIPYFFCESISAGGFLSVAFFHMIPTYLIPVSRNPDFINSIIFLSSLCFLFLFDLLARNVTPPHKTQPVPQYTDPAPQTLETPTFIPYLEENGLLLPKCTIIGLLFFLIFSSAGLAFAISAASENHTIFVISLTICFQKFFELTSMGVQFLKMKMSNLLYWIILGFYSLLTPAIAVSCGYIIDLGHTHLKGPFNAASASMFVFLGTSQWYRIFFCPYDYTFAEQVWICLLFFAGFIIVGSTGLVWSVNEGM
jgi:zinc transporter ZupT